MSSRTLLDSAAGVRLWLVELGGGLNRTYFVECPRFEHSQAFPTQDDAARFLQAYAQKSPGASVRAQADRGRAPQGLGVT